MKFRALATDYDGTIAEEGCVDAATLESLMRAKEAGLQIILVTGRELTDLFNTFPHYGLFERIVGENGAVLFDPAAASLRTLAPPPPPELVDLLTARAIPVSVGHSVIATSEPHGPDVADAIERLGLEWDLTFNKESVMALPRGITKASGLAAALGDLLIPRELVVGVGDAENDEAFLQACGMAAAVANALPLVKALAHVVTSGAGGEGVSELIDRLLAGELL